MRKKAAPINRDELRRQLIAEDEQFAFRLSQLQADSFPKRLKNMSEWSEAQKAKTAIMQVHGIIEAKPTKLEHSGALTIRWESDND